MRVRRCKSRRHSAARVNVSKSLQLLALLCVCAQRVSVAVALRGCLTQHDRPPLDSEQAARGARGGCERSFVFSPRARFAPVPAGASGRPSAPQHAVGPPCEREARHGRQHERHDDEVEHVEARAYAARKARICVGTPRSRAPCAQRRCSDHAPLYTSPSQLSEYKSLRSLPLFACAQRGATTLARVTQRGCLPALRELTHPFVGSTILVLRRARTRVSSAALRCSAQVRSHAPSASRVLLRLLRRLVASYQPAPYCTLSSSPGRGPRAARVTWAAPRAGPRATGRAPRHGPMGSTWARGALAARKGRATATCIPTLQSYIALPRVARCRPVVSAVVCGVRSRGRMGQRANGRGVCVENEWNAWQQWCNRLAASRTSNEEGAEGALAANHACSSSASG
jgi:hypothetical protein